MDAVTSPVATVATVDLTPFRLGGTEDRRAVAAQVDEACRTTGFLAVTGHGVPAGVVERMFAVTGAFFDLPLEEKLRHRVADPSANRGYTAEGTEALGYSLGRASPPDLFEAFNVGWEVAEDEVDDYVAAARATFLAPNRWPERPAGFRAAWLDYWHAVDALGDTLLAACAVALGLPDGWFVPLFDRDIAVMRAVNYERRDPATTFAPGQMRMGPHSDYGSLTILAADPVPGLQILADDGTWLDVVPPAGGFLVNLGDLMAEWTNDRWRSTVHRVVPPAGDGPVRRRSVAWFQQPNYDAVIEVLPTCTSADDPPRYPPVTSGEHLLGKLLGPKRLRPSQVAPAFRRRLG
jgi:isopenicillin N synthase-like dioxygenase